jgi:hypothetical protein
MRPGVNGVSFEAMGFDSAREREWREEFEGRRKEVMRWVSCDCDAVLGAHCAVQYRDTVADSILARIRRTVFYERHFRHSTRVVR